jgi:predicted nucleic acid-binding protein
MPAEVFFDSSVLLYTLSKSDHRSKIAANLLDDGGFVSVQVLNEVANVVRKKLGFDWKRIAELLQEMRFYLQPPLNLTVHTHEQALQIANRYQFSMYDSMIIASALEADCTTLYSEDMQDGEKIGGLTIRNPFARP